MRAGNYLFLVLLVADTRAQTPVRVSIGNAPPLEWRDASGRPQGFAVDVIREAARRQGTPLVWLSGGNAVANDNALRAGTLDLISAATATDERRAVFFVSEPWWWSEIMALAPAGGAVQGEGDLRGKTLATPAAASLSVTKYYKASTVVVGSNTRWAAEQACSGAADAAVIEAMYLRELLLAASPVCRDVRLRSFDLSVRRDYQIVARPALAGTARSLRQRIDEMTLDGTLAMLAARHLPVSTPQASRMAELLRARHSSQLQRLGLIIASVAALAGFAFLLWQQYSRRRLLALNTRLQIAQKELQSRLAEKREAEERIVYQAQLIAQTPDPVIAADNEHVVTFWNEAAGRLLGWSRTEAIGKKLGELAVPAAGAVMWTGVQECLAATGRFYGELVWLNRAGVPITIDAAMTRLLNAAGEPIGYVGGFRDITESRQGEEALRRSEQRLRLITETIPVGILVFNAAGHVTFTNSIAASLLAVERADIVGRHHNAPDWIFTDFDGNALPPEERPFLRVLATRKPVFGVNFAVQFADGKRTCLSVNAAPLFGRGGGARGLDDAAPQDEPVEGVVESMEDVTAHYELEKHYRHAQKMESLGHMAGGVAHDFNNLLTVITGYSHLLLGQMDAGSPLRPQVQQISAAGKRATELTRQLLAFSRNQLVSPQFLNLNQVIRNDEPMLRHVTGEGIDFVLRLAPSLGSIFADETQVQQVLMNLVINARDAMPGGGRLFLETSNTTMPDGRNTDARDESRRPCVELVVEDTGSGMDPETLKHIFDPFFTTKDVGKGTGLGLSTVYGIVRQTGGSIQVESRPGKGARFSVCFPIIHRPVHASPPAEVVVASLQLAAVRGSETVLLVEDQADVRRYLAECLRGAGYAVLEATSGKQALEISRGHRERLDLLITDMMMPGMSGKELAEELGLERPEICVLLISGYSAERIEPVQLPRHRFRILQKPISPSALTGAVRGILAVPVPPAV